MSGATKLMTAGGGGVSLTPASSIASDVTVNLPVTGVNNGTLVCSDSSGNVGIGLTNPAAKLDVKQVARISRVDGAANLDLEFYNPITYAGNIARIRADGDGISNYYGALSFWTGRLDSGPIAERMRIDSSGNLLVGCTGLNVNAPDVAGGTYKLTNGNTKIRVDIDGRPAFQFYSPTGGTTNVVGQVTINASSTAYTTTSDYRAKENIQPMQNALAVVQQLNPVTYTWKADGSDGQGFIAHELQAVVPDCVTGEKDAVDEEGKPVYQGIDTSFLVATLTKAIQEQQAQIETLTAKVAALEAK